MKISAKYFGLAVEP